MRVERSKNADELSALADPWNDLAAGIPFRTYEWLIAWWRHYGPAMQATGRNVELYVVQVFDGNELIGLAPWYIDHSRSGGAIIRLLGSGEVCSDYLSILHKPHRREHVAANIAAWLIDNQDRGNGDHWDLIELTNVDEQDQISLECAANLGACGAEIHTRQTENTWRIELPESIDLYLDQLSKSHRKQLRQLRRRFLDTNRATLRSVKNADQLEQGWRILRHLNERRMERLGRKSTFASRAFIEFHRAVSAMMFEAGRLQLDWLEFDGRPIAAEYHLLGTDAVYAYQGGIEPDALEWEPGRLITLPLLERAIEKGFTAFDFCRGDEPYKAHWRAKPRKQLNLRIVSNRHLARLRHCLWLAGQNARKWVKTNCQFTGPKT